MDQSGGKLSSQASEIVQAGVMNLSNKESVTMTFQGQISLSREALMELLREALAVGLQLPAQDGGGPKAALRLAYTMRETAEILGCSYITVHRLVQRGL